MAKREHRHSKATQSDPPLRVSRIRVRRHSTKNIEVEGGAQTTASGRPSPAPSAARRTHTPLSNQPAAGTDTMETPSLDRVIEAVVSLTRAVRLEMHDEEIVYAYMQELKQLFPGRHLAIRLFAHDTGRLTLVYATGRLRPARRDEMTLSREALERHGLDASLTRPSLLHVPAYVPLFHDAAEGFDVPLIDGDDVIGVMAAEYPPGMPTPQGDRSVLVPLALQLASALRHARLLREATYLREYLSKLIDHANAPIVVLGKRREVTVINQAMLALTGTAREKILGRDVISLIPAKEQQRVATAIVNAMRGIPTTNLELQLPLRDRRIARVSLNIASVVSAEGEVEGVIAIGRDLTEVRLLEEQVLQAEKLATLGQLAAGVVHELNNPLTSIAAYGEYLLKKGEREQREPGDLEKLRRIVESAERIFNFTRDLVTYARPSVEPQRSIGIGDVLDQSIVFCEHVLKEHGVTVEKSYTDAMPHVLAVRSQLHQVFINLITNACHAMPKERGRLRVSTVREDDFVIVRVSDNGEGIAADHLPRIFEPFFTTKSEGRGTGLGLSIVRNIVEQHHGVIHVESEIGRGTTFTIRLPTER